MAKRHKGSKASQLPSKQISRRETPTSLAAQFGSVLVDSCLRRTESALAGGDGVGALRWLEQVPEAQRSKTLLAAIHYEIAKDAAAGGDWVRFERELTLATKEDPSPLYQQRLALARRRRPVMDDGKWRTLCASVDPAKRLAAGSLAPAVSGVWSCGAYFSRGTMSGRPWSKLLRGAKNPPESPDEREAVVGVAAGFLCRFLLEKTPLLSKIDTVVAIPANPARYNARRMSLPDELARSVETHLAVPFVFTALIYKGDADLDLRGLSWAERSRAVKNSMDAGDLGVAAGRRVLVVDDVVTSGATLTEAARLLREAGASDVYALTVCHTEG